MERIINTIGRAGNYMATMGIADFIDIIIVAFLIYRTIWFVRKSSFINLAKGLILVLLALWASEFFGLIMINYILRKGVELGMIALVILFQPELRRLLERMGSTLNTNIGLATAANVVKTVDGQGLDLRVGSSLKRLRPGGDFSQVPDIQDFTSLKDGRKALDLSIYLLNYLEYRCFLTVPSHCATKRVILYRLRAISQVTEHLETEMP